MPDRPDWDIYFMNIAKDVAARSTCPRASVGAVIVKDKRILSTGYNGAPPGEAHCTEVGCLMINNHCERTIHAETNAVVQAAKFGVNIDGSTLYCWSERHQTQDPFEGTVGKPVANCIKCTQVMKAAGIIRVVNN
jgi:dCMP deaminase